MRSDSELAHFGITGMKWGHRKYQYEDGSLTPAGREHYGIGKARKDKTASATKGKAPTSQTTEETRPRTYRDYTNEELRAKSERNNLERQYLQSVNDLNRLAYTEPAKTFRTKLIEKFKDKAIDAISDVAVSTGKKYVQKKLDTWLNLQADQQKKKKDDSDD